METLSMISQEFSQNTGGLEIKAKLMQCKLSTYFVFSHMLNG